jgi:DNA modification methylase
MAVQSNKGAAGRCDRKLQYIGPSELKPDPRNPRKHSRTQIRAIAKSIQSFGFNAPILTDRQQRVVAGHGRLEAAKFLGLDAVPVISLDDLTEAQAKAYMLADNKLTDRSSFDPQLVAVHLKELSEIALEFDLEDTGFEFPEIDLLIQGLEEQDDADAADEFAKAEKPAVTRLGDLWHLGEHRIFCGSALDPAVYRALLGDDAAAAVFTDPPYNVKIAGNVSGLGANSHREFAMASGEMKADEFTSFLTTALGLAQRHSRPGALVYGCMDWRHLGEMLAAGQANRLDLLNVCVWVKTNGGMGSLYRSQHEMVFVFRNGPQPHRNNVQLGRFGRNRTNVWVYPGANSFTRKGGERALDLHPTVKPVGLVADALLDSTAQQDIVLDPFLGSGTTILAAQRTRRRGHGIELDPLYVDTAIGRWQRLTGKAAQLSTGETFAQLQAVRGDSDEPG